MSILSHTGKCPYCNQRIIFSKKKVIQTNNGDIFCPHCNKKLRHNRIKWVISILLPLFPMVLINHEYPTYIRLISLVICIFFIIFSWIILGYKGAEE